MGQKRKKRICSETEKKKAELFNHVDELISTNHWDEAENILGYLYRTTPKASPSMNYKFALLHFKQKNYIRALGFLQKLIPTSDYRIYALLFPCLIAIGEKKHALLELAKAPLTIQEKREFLSMYFELNHSRKQPVFNFRCSKCNGFLFFIERQAICLECNPLFVLSTNF